MLRVAASFDDPQELVLRELVLIGDFVSLALAKTKLCDIDLRLLLARLLDPLRHLEVLSQSVVVIG